MIRSWLQGELIPIASAPEMKLIIAYELSAEVIFFHPRAKKQITFTFPNRSYALLVGRLGSDITRSDDVSVVLTSDDSTLGDYNRGS